MNKEQMKLVEDAKKDASAELLKAIDEAVSHVDGYDIEKIDSKPVQMQKKYANRIEEGQVFNNNVINTAYDPDHIIIEDGKFQLLKTIRKAFPLLVIEDTAKFKFVKACRVRGEEEMKRLKKKDTEGRHISELDTSKNFPWETALRENGLDGADATDAIVFKYMDKAPLGGDKGSLIADQYYKNDDGVFECREQALFYKEESTLQQAIKDIKTTSTPRKKRGYNAF